MGTAPVKVLLYYYYYFDGYSVERGVSPLVVIHSLFYKQILNIVVAPKPIFTAVTWLMEDHRQTELTVLKLLCSYNVL